MDSETGSSRPFVSKLKFTAKQEEASMPAFPPSFLCRFQPEIRRGRIRFSGDSGFLNNIGSISLSE